MKPLFLGRNDKLNFLIFLNEKNANIILNVVHLPNKQIFKQF